MASEYIPPQQLREFIFQHICEHLTPKEVEYLAYSQNLPASYLRKDAPEVLLKLELLDKFSASNLTPLADMLRVIGRKDLAKRVEKYKSNFKKQKEQKNSKKSKDTERAVDEHTLKECKVAAGLQMAKLQVRMFLEQMEEVQATARGLSYRGLDDNLTDAIEIIERQLQRTLSLASEALSLRCTSTDSSSEESFSSSLTVGRGIDGEEVKSPVPTLERYCRPRSDALSVPKKKTRSLPKDFTTGDLEAQATPDTEVEHDYEYVQMGTPPLKSLQVPPATGDSLYYESTQIVPQSSRDDSNGKLVVGRDGAAKKPRPAIAPKPTIKQIISASSQQRDQTAEYTGGSRDTSTGDSGFVDATKYRKEQPPPQVHPKHKYTPLKAEQRETATYYAGTSLTSAQDVLYEEVNYSDDNPYVNIDLMGRSTDSK